MRVYDTEIVEGPNWCELRAKVGCDTHWVWGDDPFPLWYRYPPEYSRFLDSENGDPFAAACLIPAMVLGEPLEIEGCVSPKMHDAVSRVQAIYRCWDRELKEVAVHAPLRNVANQSPGGSGDVGLYFSLGVHSSYSLWKNLTREPCDAQSITDLIVVEGFDVRLGEGRDFQPVLANIRHLAKHFQKRVLPITTNLREFSDRTADWDRLYFGAALASAILPLGAKFRHVVISAAQTYARLEPSGAHPLLDPLWATETLSFEHDGLEATRLQKTTALAKSEALVKNLRICTTGEVTESYNCGKCEKCLRTMIALHVVRALTKCETLPHEIDVERVREMSVTGVTARESLEELVHTLGSSGKDAEIKAALREGLARQERGRTPIISITGTVGKTTTGRMVAHLLANSGTLVGLSSTHGVTVGGKRVATGDQSGFKGARMVLENPRTQTAVLETASGNIARFGLGFVSCDVGVCLNVSNDHLGQYGFTNLEDVARVKQEVIESALRAAVLNAEDPLCAAMADHTPAAIICYVSLDPGNSVVRRHIEAGGVGAVVEECDEGSAMAIYDQRKKRLSLPVHLVPATLNGMATHNVQNALFAAAIAYCSGVPEATIVEGLKTFDNSFGSNAGRLNVFDLPSFRVILDFAHNQAGVAGMAQLVQRMEVKGCRIGVVGSVCDRRDEDIRGIGAAAAGSFDCYICYCREREDLNGRELDAVPELLLEGMLSAGVPRDRIVLIPEEERAVAHALQMGRAGDLILICARDIERSRQQITSFRPVISPKPAG